MNRTILRHASTPLHCAACLYMTSASPVMQLPRKPQRAVFKASVWSVAVPSRSYVQRPFPVAALSRSKEIGLSSRSAQRKIWLRAGTRVIK